jgi:hypothetical protein
MIYGDTAETTLAFLPFNHCPQAEKVVVAQISKQLAPGKRPSRTVFPEQESVDAVSEHHFPNLHRSVEYAG